MIGEPAIGLMLARLLRKELGHVPSPWPATVQRAVTRMAAAAGVDEASWVRAQTLSPDPAAIDALVAAATVPHTAFFRHPEQLEFVTTAVLPRLARDRKGPVRIWSAGCATGEEAYSLALAAQDARVEVEILATDVSQEALSVARAGRYEGRRVRELPHAAGSTTWSAPEALRETIRFHRSSLVGPDPSVGRSPLDVIFCRNVLIYFDPEGAHRVFSMLRKLLSHDGWLVVAPAEAVVHPEGVYADPAAPLGFFRPRPISQPLARPAIGQERGSYGASAPYLPRGRGAPAEGGSGDPAYQTSSPAPPPVAPPTLPPPPSRLERGARLLGMGELDAAEEVLTSLLNDAPEHGPAWFLLGELLFQRGERVQAKTAFLRAARCPPGDGLDDVDAATLSRAAERRAKMC